MKTQFSRGLSLIETVVVVALTAFVMLTLTGIIFYFYRTNAYTLEQTQAISSARTSLAHTVSDLRQASYGADGSYPILAASTSTVTFYSNIDGNGMTDRVRYYIAGTTLYRGNTTSAGNPPSYTGQPEQTTLVVDNIRNSTSTPLFSYFDTNGTALTAPINIVSIASVQITVYTDVNPNRAPTVYMLSGSATLRNVHNMNTQ